jgi:hypothetical protein
MVYVVIYLNILMILLYYIYTLFDRSGMPNQRSPRCHTAAFASLPYYPVHPKRVLLIAFEDRIFHDLSHKFEILNPVFWSLPHVKALDTTIEYSLFHSHVPQKGTQQQPTPRGRRPPPPSGGCLVYGSIRDRSGPTGLGMGPT